MLDSCDKHPHEPGAALCRRCGHSWCSACLVYVFGPKNPPFCMSCVRCTQAASAATPPGRRWAGGAEGPGEGREGRGQGRRQGRQERTEGAGGRGGRGRLRRDRLVHPVVGGPVSPPRWPTSRPEDTRPPLRLKGRPRHGLSSHPPRQHAGDRPGQRPRVRRCPGSSRNWPYARRERRRSCTGAPIPAPRAPCRSAAVERRAGGVPVPCRERREPDEVERAQRSSSDDRRGHRHQTGV